MRSLLLSRLRLIPNPIKCRTILTHSIDPPAHIPESPNSILLLEQNLPYSFHNGISSWHETFAKHLQAKGVNYRRSDAFNPLPSTKPALPGILATLADDISSASDGVPSRLLLVARGPIPSLLAQYHLESLPLGGLILIDPFIFAGEDNDYGRNDAQILLNHSEDRSFDGGEVNVKSLAPTPASTEFRGEMEFLRNLSEGDIARKLKLEPGSVPVMVMWSSSFESPGVKGDAGSSNTRWEKDRVHRTADFHRDAESGTEVDLIEIDKNKNNKDAELDIIYNFLEERIF